ncbi:hypothetical protein O181_030580 [Austropuccinia psidii MF-1]|uniref:Integrase catalytic domain-containing protein n=1 Tax=Austropuccinia psidii MF-1 TaxID=1389203 RepID=A0A9Q3CXH0_9BASI|nr:hypothetical protein [Austropuccinia psidii MF-1]
MSERKFDLDDLRAALINSASESGAQFKHQVKINWLGEGITPCLTSDGLNFHRWSRSLIQLIERTHTNVDYFSSVDKDGNRTRNYEIRTYIEKSISGDLNNSIEEEDEARKAYKLLRRHFEKHSWSHVMNLFDDLLNSSDTLGNLNESYVAIKTNVSNLKSALGSIWDDEAIVAIFFHYQNKQFFHEISTAIDAKLPLDDKVWIRAEDILQVAQRFQRRNDVSSMASPPSVLATSSSTHRHGERTSGVRFPPQKPVTPARQIPLSQQSESWAKYHLMLCHIVVSRRWKWRRKSPSSHQFRVLQTMNSKKHRVIGRGLIRLECPSGDLFLSGALYCPDIPGWFSKTHAAMSCNAMVESSNLTATLFHRRLAHMSLRTIRKMQKLNCVEGLPSVVVHQDVKICRPCLLAKIQHIPLSSSSRGIVEQPGDVIVADLMGPFPISFDKRIYAMLVQDHFSSLVTVYPLWSKSEADNASEFLSNNLKRLFEESGITHETIIPYKHHQAGKVERTNRTISEAAQSMLIDSGVDVCLWSYAFRQAVWVFNQVVHGLVDKTPYEMVTGRKPSSGVVRVFGCRAYVHNLTHRKDLSPKAKELIHLGIAEDLKGWIFWDAVPKQVVRSASVVFDKGDVGKATIPSAHSIKINNLFDPTMLKEIMYQDEALNITAAGCSLHNDSPSTYHEAMASSDHYR